MNADERFSLSAQEAASLLGISISSFYLHLQRGTLKLKRRMRGGRVCFLRRDVEKVAEAGWENRR